MNNPKRKGRVSLVDVLVGLAILMILSALVVPVFIPPDGRAASKVATTSASGRSARH
jgi:Tfp pilus assembly protein FimT